MSNKNEDRNYSIDLLKFICMFGIIILHLTAQGGLLQLSANNYITVNIYRIINNIFLVSVNIFCIITGYLYAEKKKTHCKNVIDIIFTMIFYSIIITVVFYSFDFYNVRNLGKLELLRSLFPPMVGRYWFVTCYVFLFFMINYINKFLNILNKKQHRILIIIIFVFFSLFSEIGAYDYFRIQWGYSPFWLIYLYMIGSYIKKYKIKISLKKCVLLLLLCEGGNILIMLFAKNFLPYNNIFYNLGNNYNSPLIVIISILFFYVFINLNIKNTLFSKLGKYSLSVIIIHSHRLIYDLVINNNMIIIKKYNFVCEVLLLLGGALLIYLLCVIIEIIKRNIFKITKIASFISKLGDKLDKKLNIN